MITLNDKVKFFCDKVIEYCLYGLIFFLPASKSMVEVCATTAFLAWLVKSVINLSKANSKINRLSFIDSALILSILALIPVAALISYALSTLRMDLSLATPLPFYVSVIISFTAVSILAVIMVSLRGADHISLKLRIPFLLFIDVAAITAIITSHHINISMGAFFFKILEYLMIFIMMAEVINTRKRVINILIVMLLSSFIIGLDGVYQLFTRFDFLRKFPLYAGKMTASFQFPNNLGAYLAAILPIPISFVIQGGGTNKKVRFCLSVLSILLTVCLLFTRARGAWIGFVVGMLIVCFFSGRRAFFIAIASLVVLIAFSPPMIRNQIGSFTKLTSDLSTGDRVIIWKTGWRMFIDRPILGHGLGTFMSVFNAYKPANYSDIVYAHNCYLQMAAETGLLGVLIFIWLVFALAKDAFFRFIKSGDNFLKALLTGLLGGIFAYLTHSFFDTNLYSLSLAVLFWALAGLAAAKIQLE